MSRQAVLAGNWKMNTTPSEGVTLIKQLKERLSGYNGPQTIVAPPYTHLHPIAQEIKGASIALSAQDVYLEESGAFTGEISPSMLKDIGCEFTIAGHSERRQYFSETDASVNQKALLLLSHEITPIICVGETLEERESGQALDIVRGQIEGALKQINESHDIIIAYEPVWAIGTGKTASTEQAQEVHAYIRATIKELIGSGFADKTRILYGGSVKPDNVDDLMAQPDIDGALVGGASLKADSFERIVKFK